MSFKFEKKQINLIIFLITLVIFLLSLSTGMFWDNVLFASHMGTYILESGLKSISIPIEFDSGHPPFLAFLMAVGWKVFGKTLFVSHLMMVPFIFGLLWQLYAFISCFLEKKEYRILAFVLLLADPTLLSQLFLVNPQVIQLFFFFLTINALLRNHSLYKILGLGFMGIITFRGMMLCAGVFIFDFLYQVLINRKKPLLFFSRKLIIEYALGSIPAVTYVAWRLLTKGWIMSCPDSPWSENWQMAGIFDVLRNIVVLVHRYVDFGRMGVFIFLALVFFIKRQLYLTKEAQTLLLLALSSDIVIVVVSLSVGNPMGHRYFISSYLSFILLAFLILMQLRKGKMLIYGLLLVSLIGGNLWVYPDRIAQGWDASMAFYPYFNLRKEAIEFMDENKIPVENTASFFPNSVIIDWVDLSGDQRKFQKFTGAEEYVFYSNVYNPSDEEFDLIAKNYTPIHTFKKNRIRVILYHINSKK